MPRAGRLHANPILRSTAPSESNDRSTPTIFCCPHVGPAAEISYHNPIPPVAKHNTWSDFLISHGSPRLPVRARWWLLIGSKRSDFEPSHGGGIPRGWGDGDCRLAAAPTGVRPATLLRWWRRLQPAGHGSAEADIFFSLCFFSWQSYIWKGYIYNI